MPVTIQYHTEKSGHHWIDEETTLDDNGNACVEETDYFHVFYKNEYYCFLIQKKTLYRIDYENKDLSASKATVKNNALIWVHATASRLILTGIDASSLKEAQKIHKIQQQETELADLCQALLRTVAERAPDPVQTRQLLGNTPTQEAEEYAEDFHQKAFSKYQKKIQEHLTEITKQTEKNNQPLLRSQITAFLTLCWQHFHPMYFANPEHPATQALIRLAEMLARLENSEKSPHEFFMPTIGNFQTSCRPEHFTHDLRTLSITDFLKTHLVNQALTVPLPIALCLNPKPDTTDQEFHNAPHLFSPYYDLFSDHFDPSHQFITDENWYRLWNHSPLTRAVFSAQERYDKITNDSSTLLGQINLLCKTFGEHGSHDGMGTSENAAEGAYPAILSFFDYYDSLSDNSKMRVPLHIKTQLETIRAQHFTANNQSLDHRKGMLTCISMHRTSLLHLLTLETKTALDAISWSNEKRNKGIERAETDLAAFRKQLEIALKNPRTYQSDQKINKTPALLIHLQLPLTINTFNDLARLRAFTAHEISELLSAEPVLKQDIFKHIDTPNPLSLINLSQFLLTHPAAQTIAILKLRPDSFLLGFLGHNSYDRLPLLLRYLPPEKIVDILTALPELLIIIDTKISTSLAESLATEQLEALKLSKSRHPNFSQIANKISQFLYFLPTEAPPMQEQKYLAIIQFFIENFSINEMKVASKTVKSLLNMDNFSLLNPSAFVKLFQNLNPERFSCAFSIFKDDLYRHIIHQASNDSFQLILNSAPIKHYDHTLHELRMASQANATHPIFLNLCFQALTQLSDEKKNITLPLLTADIFEDFRILSHTKDQHPAAYIIIFRYIQNNLSTLAPTAFDFYKIFSVLDDPEKIMVFNLSKSNIIALLSAQATTNDFLYILSYLSARQFLELWEAIKDSFEHSIIDIKTLCLDLKRIPKEHLNFLIEQITPKISSLIQSINDFSMIWPYFRDLSNEKKNITLPLLTAGIFNNLDNTKDKLPTTYSNISRERKNDLFVLTPIITFSLILSTLNIQERAMIFNSRKSNIIALLLAQGQTEDFLYILSYFYLPTRQVHELWEAVKDSFRNAIIDIKTLCLGLDRVPEDYLHFLIEDITPKIPSLIQSADDFIMICPYLPPQNKTFVYHCFKEHQYKKPHSIFNEIKNRIEFHDAKQVNLFIQTQEYIDWLETHKTKNQQEKIKYLNNMINRTTDTGRKNLFSLKKQNLLSQLLEPSAVKEENALKDRLFLGHHSNKTVTGINEKNINHIKNELIQAIENYITWNNDKKLKEYSRRSYGLFTHYRHTQKGVTNACELKNNITQSDSPEALSNCINDFLQSYTRLGGKYNTHSCASFILDVLSGRLPESRWRDLADRYVTAHRHPGIFRVPSSHNCFHD